MRKYFYLFALLLIPFVSAESEIHVIGRVSDAADGAPLSSVQILMKSGRKLVESNSNGQFEFDVNSKNTVLVFKKTGFEEKQIPLNEFSDLFDVQVSLISKIKVLDQSLIQTKSDQKKQNKQPNSIVEIEKKTGMMIDLMDHLTTLPGMAQPDEFSSKISFEGSKPGDVQQSIHGISIPQLRHLDFGLPGNMSSINPKNLSSIRNQSQKNGVLSQGLGTQIDFIPNDKTLSSTDYNLNLSSVQYEAAIDGPLLGADHFSFAYRQLNDFFLQKLGEKYFTTFNKKITEDCKQNKCSELGSEFSLASSDFWLSWQAKDTLGNKQSLVYLGLNDRWNIRQDTSSTNIQNLTNSKIEQFIGNQNSQFVSYSYGSAEGDVLAFGYGRTYQIRSLRNIKGFQYSENPAEDQNVNLLSEKESTESKFSTNYEKLFDLFDGFQTSQLGEVHFYKQEIKEKLLSNKTLKVDEIQFDMGLRLGKESAWGSMVSHVGAEYLKNAQKISPLVSLHSEWTHILGEKSGLGMNASVKTQAKTQVVDYGSVQYQAEQNYVGDLFAKKQKNGFGVEVRAYGRYVPEPSLPTPEALWFYKNLSKAEYAWSAGSSITTSYENSLFVFSNNLSRTNGEYSLKEGPLKWESARKLDVISRLRYFPREDTVLAFTLIHRGQLGVPLYTYEITRTDKTNLGTRRIVQNKESLDLWRTDLKLDLQLNSQIKPLKNTRLYFEVDNIFSGLDIKGLGQVNEKQRGEEVVLQNGQYKIDPFMGKGMGFFMQFGVEGNFGF